MSNSKNYSNILADKVIQMPLIGHKSELKSTSPNWRVFAETMPNGGLRLHATKKR